MYLKSIEMHGFKSFANKIVFEFHNGITGIVGPNGSGKSNVADAVRWVLGEQSAKQLRGASMQDVIFAGTENRKPLSYAYVAITMDNSDHVLPVDYEEVTIARRVYRSGESEYLLNGVACRLKDVTELFYDTGIGKEGYSIIGQGQIEKILSGKPEERRELFDEAVGIVKYKKRKVATQKKLSEERENLTRINDILGELERQVGPLEKQAETAREYVKKRDELKTLDVNMYLFDMERLNKEQEEVSEKLKVSENEKNENEVLSEKMKKEYAEVENELYRMEDRLEEIRLEQEDTKEKKQNLLHQIDLFSEQIRSAESSGEQVRLRKEELQKEKEAKEAEKKKIEEERDKQKAVLNEIQDRLKEAEKYKEDIQKTIFECNEGIERDNIELQNLLNERAEIKSEDQRYKTLLEQTNIRKSELTRRILDRKTEEMTIEDNLSSAQKKYDEISKAYDEKKAAKDETDEKIRDRREKRRKSQDSLGEKMREYQRAESRLESLKNIAERYDGYGNAIRRVMEHKDDNPGLIGVVSDLIHVEKKYETAIETALGGNIQNVVTEDEETAKKEIRFLKENKAGRVTFLPLTSVKGNDKFKEPDALKEKGVLGRACELSNADKKFDGVVNYLLGRVLVVNTVDDATSIARKYHYGLHIVTLEGEYLAPGGSMAGGAFKNKGNLLARNREIEELEDELKKMKDEVKKLQDRIDELNTAIELLNEDKEEADKELQELLIKKNTEEINLKRASEEKEKADEVFNKLKEDSKEIERQVKDIEEKKTEMVEKIRLTEEREVELQEDKKKLQATLDEKTYMEEPANRNISEIQIEEANAVKDVEHCEENIARVQSEIDKNEADTKDLLSRANLTEDEINEKKKQIEETKLTIEAAEKREEELREEYRKNKETKEELNKKNKGFIEKRESITERLSKLAEEIVRLENRKEKITDQTDYKNNYMWENYELTLHSAKELKDETLTDIDSMRQRIGVLKDEIRKMGNVNVNAIEEYMEVSERYNFLKGQHDDLIQAEETLLGIIDELDTGMREQFEKGFAEIQVEFDKAFKDLFGGGKGTLELTEGEDVLETGIRIIAQPPGKKLQNMMQLSGGEKSLTAIALLFAIQNLKPSPFCLLDEIEAALDDSNVGRFAKYLHKLTDHTQFIVITHRRGTMNAADRLYGITMQEKGVSALVSVNLIEDDLDE